MRVGNGRPSLIAHANSRAPMCSWLTKLISRYTTTIMRGNMCRLESMMPSPFPGMDPYLEGDLWQEFHDRLANQISVQLLPLLRPKYVALLAKRYVLDSPALGVFDIAPPHIFYPDVHVATSPAAGTTASPSSTQATITEPTVELP